MLTSLLPVIARQAKAILGDTAEVTVEGDRLRVVAVSLRHWNCVYTLEEWMGLVAQELESRD